MPPLTTNAGLMTPTANDDKSRSDDAATVAGDEDRPDDDISDVIGDDAVYSDAVDCNADSGADYDGSNRHCDYLASSLDDCDLDSD